MGVLAAAALVIGCGTTASAGCDCAPTLVSVAGGEVWAAQGRTLSRLDAESGELQSRVEVVPRERGDGPVEAIALNGEQVWLGWSAAVAAVRPSGAIAFRRARRPPGYATGMATMAGRTWLAAGRRAIALAPDGSIRMRARLPARASGLVAGDGVVWAVGGRLRRVKVLHRGWTTEPAGPGYAIALDAATGRRVRELATAPGPTGLVAWRDRVWIASPSGLDQLDAATGRVVRHVPLSLGSIAAGEGSLWALTRDGTLSRMDPATGAPAGSPLALGQDVSSIATGAGAVWAGLRESGVMRIDAATMRVSWRRSIPPT